MSRISGVFIIFASSVCILSNSCLCNVDISCLLCEVGCGVFSFSHGCSCHARLERGCSGVFGISGFRVFSVDPGCSCHGLRVLGGLGDWALFT